MTSRYRRDSGYPSSPDGLGIAPNIIETVVATRDSCPPLPRLSPVLPRFLANGSHAFHAVIQLICHSRVVSLHLFKIDMYPRLGIESTRQIGLVALCLHLLLDLHGLHQFATQSEKGRAAAR